MSEQAPKGTARPKQAPVAALAAHAPWIPPDCTIEVIGAIQALNRGQAEPHQQTLVLNWLIEFCRNEGCLYFPGQDGRRDTDFALGRAFPAQVLTTILALKPRQGSEQG